MAQLTIGQFKALYGLTGTTFPDNILGLISEGDMRQFGEDIADSFVNIIESSPVFPNQDFDITMSPWINASGSNRGSAQNFQWESGGFLRANGSPELTKYLAVTRTNGWPAGDYQILIRAKNDSIYGGSGGDVVGVSAWTMTDPSNQTTADSTTDGDFPRDNTFYTRTVSFTLDAPTNYLAFAFGRLGGGGTFDINVVVDYIRLNSYTPTGDVYATEAFVTNAIANIDISDLSGTITNNLIFGTTAGIQFIVGENIAVNDSSWSAFFGENHVIDGIFNDGIVAGEDHTSTGDAGNNAIFGRANSLTGTGGKFFNLLVGDSNVLFAGSGLQSNGNFIMGINNELQDTDNSSIISGTNITGTASNTAYAQDINVAGNIYMSNAVESFLDIDIPYNSAGAPLFGIRGPADAMMGGFYIVDNFGDGSSAAIASGDWTGSDPYQVILITPAGINVTSDDGFGGQSGIGVTPEHILFTTGGGLQFNMSQSDGFMSFNGDVHFNNNADFDVVPTADGDTLATETFAENVATDRQDGVNWKRPVIAASTANVDLSNAGTTLDGIAINVVGTRVLLKDQTIPAQNGIHVVSSLSPTVLTRATDFDSIGAPIYRNAFVPVDQGNTHAGKIFRLTTPNPIVIGSSSISFEDVFQYPHDIAITDSGSGLILKDTQGTPHYWRVTISTLGVLTTTDLGTSIP